MSVQNACEIPLLPLSTISSISTLLKPLTPLITANLCAEEEGGHAPTNKDTAATTAALTKVSTTSKDLSDTSRNSDSGKSSSCSPTLLDCSFDSGIAGVLLDANDMQRHKRIQLCQRILLALERDREHFCAIRNRLSKISERKKRNIVQTENLCNVCCTEIDLEDDNTFVKCFICQKYICRSIKCADWLAKTAQWECELCHTSKESLAQTSSWVADQLSFNQQKLVYPMRARSEIFIPISECNDSSIHFESVSQIGANTSLITAEQRLKIREYVEEIVSNLLGGNLDTISVNQLSKSENYLPAPKTNGLHHNHHQQHYRPNGSIVTRPNENGNILRSRESTPGPDFTDVSEARLRNMIQKIIAETVNMAPLAAKSYAVSEIALDRPSKLSESVGFASNGLRHRTEHYFEPTIYQDLLATAVLNKIVDKQSNSNTNNNNRNMSESTPDLTRSGAGIMTEDGTVGLDQNYNIENQSTISGSSIEPQSECSYTDTEPLTTTNDDKCSEFILDTGRDSALSDYIAAHMVPLPNLSTMANESEEDDYMSVTSSAVGDSTWENNWLFKKKKSTVSSSLAGSSVGMLVPDPKEDVRAQIGDKTADEISDLSELGSDTDDSSLDLLRSSVDPINDRLFNKHLIGGQNSKIVLDELIERSSMISNTLPTDQEQLYTETRNENVEAPNRTEAINSSVTQQTNDNNNEEDQKNLEAIMPPEGFDDSSSDPLTVGGDEFDSSSEDCVGFGQIEVLEPPTRTPSVIEILAAIALGPMIAVPAADEPAALTPSELNTLSELRDIALTEIKTRSIELMSHSLGVIPEEVGEMDMASFPTPDELNEKEDFIVAEPVISKPETKNDNQTSERFKLSSETVEQNFTISNEAARSKESNDDLEETTISENVSDDQNKTNVSNALSVSVADEENSNKTHIVTEKREEIIEESALCETSTEDSALTDITVTVAATSAEASDSKMDISSQTSAINEGILQSQAKLSEPQDIDVIVETIESRTKENTTEISKAIPEICESKHNLPSSAPETEPKTYISTECISETETTNETTVKTVVTTEVPLEKPTESILTNESSSEFAEPTLSALEITSNSQATELTQKSSEIVVAPLSTSTTTSELATPAAETLTEIHKPIEEKQTEICQSEQSLALSVLKTESTSGLSTDCLAENTSEIVLPKEVSHETSSETVLIKEPSSSIAAEPSITTDSQETELTQKSCEVMGAQLSTLPPTLNVATSPAETLIEIHKPIENKPPEICESIKNLATCITETEPTSNLPTACLSEIKTTNETTSGTVVTTEVVDQTSTETVLNNVTSSEVAGTSLSPSEITADTEETELRQHSLEIVVAPSSTLTTTPEPATPTAEILTEIPKPIEETQTEICQSEINLASYVPKSDTASDLSSELLPETKTANETTAETVATKEVSDETSTEKILTSTTSSDVAETSMSIIDITAGSQDTELTQKSSEILVAPLLTAPPAETLTDIAKPIEDKSTEISESEQNLVSSAPEIEPTSDFCTERVSETKTTNETAVETVPTTFVSEETFTKTVLTNTEFAEASLLEKKTDSQEPEPTEKSFDTLVASSEEIEEKQTEICEQNLASSPPKAETIKKTNETTDKSVISEETSSELAAPSLSTLEITTICQDLASTEKSSETVVTPAAECLTEVLKPIKDKNSEICESEQNSPSLPLGIEATSDLSTECLSETKTKNKTTSVSDESQTVDRKELSHETSIETVLTNESSSVIATDSHETDLKQKSRTADLEVPPTENLNEIPKPIEEKETEICGTEQNLALSAPSTEPMSDLSVQCPSKTKTANGTTSDTVLTTEISKSKELSGQEVLQINSVLETTTAENMISTASQALSSDNAGDGIQITQLKKDISEKLTASDLLPKYLNEESIREIVVENISSETGGPISTGVDLSVIPPPSDYIYISTTASGGCDLTLSQLSTVTAASENENIQELPSQPENSENNLNASEIISLSQEKMQAVEHKVDVSLKTADQATEEIAITCVTDLPIAIGHDGLTKINIDELPCDPKELPTEILIKPLMTEEVVKESNLSLAITNAGCERNSDSEVSVLDTKVTLEENSDTIDASADVEVPPASEEKSITTESIVPLDVSQEKISATIFDEVSKMPEDVAVDLPPVALVDSAQQEQSSLLHSEETPIIQTLDLSPNPAVDQNKVTNEPETIYDGLISNTPVKINELDICAEVENFVKLPENTLEDAAKISDAMESETVVQSVSSKQDPKQSSSNALTETTIETITQHSDETNSSARVESNQSVTLSSENDDLEKEGSMENSSNNLIKASVPQESETRSMTEQENSTVTVSDAQPAIFTLEAECNSDIEGNLNKEIVNTATAEDISHESQLPTAASNPLSNAQDSNELENHSSHGSTSAVFEESDNESEYLTPTQTFTYTSENLITTMVLEDLKKKLETVSSLESSSAEFESPVSDSQDTAFCCETECEENVAGVVDIERFSSDSVTTKNENERTDIYTSELASLATESSVVDTTVPSDNHPTITQFEPLDLSTTSEKPTKKVHFDEKVAVSYRRLSNTMNNPTEELTSILSSKMPMDGVSNDIIPPPLQFSFDESEIDDKDFYESMVNSVESEADIFVVPEDLSETLTEINNNVVVDNSESALPAEIIVIETTTAIDVELQIPDLEVKEKNEIDIKDNSPTIGENTASEPNLSNATSLTPNVAVEDVPPAEASTLGDKTKEIEKNILEQIINIEEKVPVDAPVTTESNVTETEAKEKDLSYEALFTIAEFKDGSNENKTSIEIFETVSEKTETQEADVDVVTEVVEPDVSSIQTESLPTVNKATVEKSILSSAAVSSPELTIAEKTPEYTKPVTLDLSEESSVPTRDSLLPIAVDASDNSTNMILSQSEKSENIIVSDQNILSSQVVVESENSELPKTTTGVTDNLNENSEVLSSTLDKETVSKKNEIQDINIKSSRETISQITDIQPNNEIIAAVSETPSEISATEVILEEGSIQEPKNAPVITLPTGDFDRQVYDQSDQDSATLLPPVEANQNSVSNLGTEKKTEPSAQTTALSELCHASTEPSATSEKMKDSSLDLNDIINESENNTIGKSTEIKVNSNVTTVESNVTLENLPEAKEICLDAYHEDLAAVITESLPSSSQSNSGVKAELPSIASEPELSKCNEGNTAVMEVSCDENFPTDAIADDTAPPTIEVIADSPSLAEELAAAMKSNIENTVPETAATDAVQDISVKDADKQPTTPEMMDGAVNMGENLASADIGIVSNTERINLLNESNLSVEKLTPQPVQESFVPNTCEKCVTPQSDIPETSTMTVENPVCPQTTATEPVTLEPTTAIPLTSTIPEDINPEISIDPEFLTPEHSISPVVSLKMSPAPEPLENERTTATEPVTTETIAPSKPLIAEISMTAVEESNSTEPETFTAKVEDPVSSDSDTVVVLHIEPAIPETSTTPKPDTPNTSTILDSPETSKEPVLVTTNTLETVASEPVEELATSETVLHRTIALVEEPVSPEVPMAPKIVTPIQTTVPESISPEITQGSEKATHGTAITVASEICTVLAEELVSLEPCKEPIIPDLQEQISPEIVIAPETSIVEPISTVTSIVSEPVCHEISTAFVLESDISERTSVLVESPVIPEQPISPETITAITTATSEKITSVTTTHLEAVSIVTYTAIDKDTEDSSAPEPVNSEITVGLKENKALEEKSAIKDSQEQVTSETPTTQGETSTAPEKVSPEVTAVSEEKLVTIEATSVLLEKTESRTTETTIASEIVTTEKKIQLEEPVSVETSNEPPVTPQTTNPPETATSDIATDLVEESLSSEGPLVPEIVTTTDLVNVTASKIEEEITAKANRATQKEANKVQKENLVITDAYEKVIPGTETMLGESLRPETSVALDIGGIVTITTSTSDLVEKPISPEVTTEPENITSETSRQTPPISSECYVIADETKTSEADISEPTAVLEEKLISSETCILEPVLPVTISKLDAHETTTESNKAIPDTTTEPKTIEQPTCPKTVTPETNKATEPLSQKSATPVSTTTPETVTPEISTVLEKVILSMEETTVAEPVDQFAETHTGLVQEPVKSDVSTAAEVVAPKISLESVAPVQTTATEKVTSDTTVALKEEPATYETAVKTIKVLGKEAVIPDKQEKDSTETEMLIESRSPEVTTALENAPVNTETSVEPETCTALVDNLETIAPPESISPKTGAELADEPINIETTAEPVLDTFTSVTTISSDKVSIPTTTALIKEPVTSQTTTGSETVAFETTKMVEGKPVPPVHIIPKTATAPEKIAPEAGAAPEDEQDDLQTSVEANNAVLTEIPVTNESTTEAIKVLHNDAVNLKENIEISSETEILPESSSLETTTTLQSELVSTETSVAPEAVDLERNTVLVQEPAMCETKSGLEKETVCQQASNSLESIFPEKTAQTKSVQTETATVLVEDPVCIETTAVSETTKVLEVKPVSPEQAIYEIETAHQIITPEAATGPVEVLDNLQTSVPPEPVAVQTSPAVLTEVSTNKEATTEIIKVLEKEAVLPVDQSEKSIDTEILPASNSMETSTTFESEPVSTETCVAPEIVELEKRTSLVQQPAICETKLGLDKEPVCQQPSHLPDSVSPEKTAQPESISPEMTTMLTEEPIFVETIATPHLHTLTAVTAISSDYFSSDTTTVLIKEPVTAETISGPETVPPETTKGLEAKSVPPVQVIPETATSTEIITREPTNVAVGELGNLQISAPPEPVTDETCAVVLSEVAATNQPTSETVKVLEKEAATPDEQTKESSETEILPESSSLQTTTGLENAHRAETTITPQAAALETSTALVQEPAFPETATAAEIITPETANVPVGELDNHQTSVPSEPSSDEITTVVLTEVAASNEPAYEIMEVLERESVLPDEQTENSQKRDAAETSAVVLTEVETTKKPTTEIIRVLEKETATPDEQTKESSETEILPESSSEETTTGLENKPISTETSKPSEAVAIETSTALVQEPAINETKLGLDNETVCQQPSHSPDSVSPEKTAQPESISPEMTTMLTEEPIFVETIATPHLHTLTAVTAISSDYFSSDTTTVLIKEPVTAETISGPETVPPETTKGLEAKSVPPVQVIPETATSTEIITREPTNVAVGELGNLQISAPPEPVIDETCAVVLSEVAATNEPTSEIVKVLEKEAATPDEQTKESSETEILPESSNLQTTTGLENAHRAETTITTQAAALETSTALVQEPAYPETATAAEIITPETANVPVGELDNHQTSVPSEPSSDEITTVVLTEVAASNEPAYEIMEVLERESVLPDEQTENSQKPDAAETSAVILTEVETTKEPTTEIIRVLEKEKDTPDEQTKESSETTTGLENKPISTETSKASEAVAIETSTALVQEPAINETKLGLDNETVCQQPSHSPDSVSPEKTSQPELISPEMTTMLTEEPIFVETIATPHLHTLTAVTAISSDYVSSDTTTVLIKEPVTAETISGPETVAPETTKGLEAKSVPPVQVIPETATSTEIITREPTNVAVGELGNLQISAPPEPVIDETCAVVLSEVAATNEPTSEIVKVLEKEAATPDEQTKESSETEILPESSSLQTTTGLENAHRAETTITPQAAALETSTALVQEPAFPETATAAEIITPETANVPVGELDNHQTSVPSEPSSDEITTVVLTEVAASNEPAYEIMEVLERESVLPDEQTDAAETIAVVLTEVETTKKPTTEIIRVLEKETATPDEQTKESSETEILPESSSEETTTGLENKPISTETSKASEAVAIETSTALVQEPAINETKLGLDNETVCQQAFHSPESDAPEKTPLSESILYETATVLTEDQVCIETTVVPETTKVVEVRPVTPEQIMPETPTACEIITPETATVPVLDQDNLQTSVPIAIETTTAVHIEVETSNEATTEIIKVIEKDADMSDEQTEKSHEPDAAETTAVVLTEVAATNEPTLEIKKEKEAAMSNEQIKESSKSEILPESSSLETTTGLEKIPVYTETSMAPEAVVLVGELDNLQTSVPPEPVSDEPSKVVLTEVLASNEPTTEIIIVVEKETATPDEQTKESSGTEILPESIILEKTTRLENEPVCTEASMATEALETSTALVQEPAILATAAKIIAPETATVPVGELDNLETSVPPEQVETSTAVLTEVSASNEPTSEVIKVLEKESLMPDEQTEESHDTEIFPRPSSLETTSMVENECTEPVVASETDAHETSTTLVQEPAICEKKLGLVKEPVCQQASHASESVASEKNSESESILSETATVLKEEPVCIETTVVPKPTKVLEIKPVLSEQIIPETATAHEIITPETATVPFGELENLPTSVAPETVAVEISTVVLTEVSTTNEPTTEIIKVIEKEAVMPDDQTAKSPDSVRTETCVAPEAVELETSTTLVQKPATPENTAQPESIMPETATVLVEEPICNETAAVPETTKELEVKPVAPVKVILETATASEIITPENATEPAGKINNLEPVAVTTSTVVFSEEAASSEPTTEIIKVLEESVMAGVQIKESPETEIFSESSSLQTITALENEPISTEISEASEAVTFETCTALVREPTICETKSGLENEPICQQASHSPESITPEKTVQPESSSPETPTVLVKEPICIETTAVPDLGTITSVPTTSTDYVTPESTTPQTKDPETTVVLEVKQVPPEQNTVETATLHDISTFETTPNLVEEVDNLQTSKVAEPVPVETSTTTNETTSETIPDIPNEQTEVSFETEILPESCCLETAPALDNKLINTATSPTVTEVVELESNTAQLKKLNIDETKSDAEEEPVYTEMSNSPEIVSTETTAPPEPISPETPVAIAREPVGTNVETSTAPEEETISCKSTTALALSSDETTATKEPIAPETSTTVLNGDCSISGQTDITTETAISDEAVSTDSPCEIISQVVMPQPIESTLDICSAPVSDSIISSAESTTLPNETNLTNKSTSETSVLSLCSPEEVIKASQNQMTENTSTSILDTNVSEEKFPSDSVSHSECSIISTEVYAPADTVKEISFTDTEATMLCTNLPTLPQEVIATDTDIVSPSETIDILTPSETTANAQPKSFTKERCRNDTETTLPKIDSEQINTTPITEHEQTETKFPTKDNDTDDFRPEIQISQKLIAAISICQSLQEASISLEENSSSSLVHQLTMVEIEIPDDEKEATGKADTASAVNEEPTVQRLGNTSNLRKLKRQYGLEYTTPSFEDVSQTQSSIPSPPQTSTGNHSTSLATLCQKYMYDKQLLAALESRRRQTLLMHRFLSTIDSFHSSDVESMEDTDTLTEVLLESINNPSGQTVVPPASAFASCSMSSPPPTVDNEQSCPEHSSSDWEDCSSDSHQISPNIDEHSHTDTISRVSTVEEIYENTDDEKDIIVHKLKVKKKSRRNMTNTTKPTTNSRTISATSTITTNSHTLTPTTPVTNNNQATFSVKTTRVSNIIDNNVPTTSVRKKSYSTASTKNRSNRNPTSECCKQSVKCITGKNAPIGPNVTRNVGSDAKIDCMSSDKYQTQNDNREEDDDLGLLPRFVPGSIAEREYKKWYNAVEMPNNPYAPEALKRRISGGQERFIDLPKIPGIVEQCPLDLITKDKLSADDSDKRDSEIKRYSRDYYINDRSKLPQNAPSQTETDKSKDVVTETSQKQTVQSEHEKTLTPATTQETLSKTELATTTETVPSSDLYTAIPAQVVEDPTSSLDTISQQSMQSANTTTSEDSDTIKIYNFKKQETTIIKEAKEKSDEQKPAECVETNDQVNKERPSDLGINEETNALGASAVTSPTRGSTPEAFKFLQPKRKLLDPSQVLSVDEDEPQTPCGSKEKPVIEKEVVNSLPSVKALAKAFLMTSNSVQHSSSKRALWPRKAKTMPDELKTPGKPTNVLEPVTPTEDKSEEDATIASDLSSLETDSLSVSKQQRDLTKEQLNQPATTAAPGSPVPVRQGVLKSNIAFFENLKNLK